MAVDFQTYYTNLKEAFVRYVNTYINKQMIDADNICAYRTKAKILAMYVDMLPLIYNCDCLSDETELQPLENLALKILRDCDYDSIGMLDHTDTTQYGTILDNCLLTDVDIEEETMSYPLIERGNKALISGDPTDVTFTQTLGTSGTSYSATFSCYNSSNEAVGYVITSRDQNGFTVTADEDARFEYTCVLI